MDMRDQWVASGTPPLQLGLLDLPSPNQNLGRCPDRNSTGGPATLHFAERGPTNWATPVRARFLLLFLMT